jgi:hypothetical protein
VLWLLDVPQIDVVEGALHCMFDSHNACTCICPTIKKIKYIYNYKIISFSNNYHLMLYLLMVH